MLSAIVMAAVAGLVLTDIAAFAANLAPRKVVVEQVRRR